MTEKELVETPPSVYCGGEFREKKYNKLLYGNMHGEDIVTKENNNWQRISFTVLQLTRFRVIFLTHTNALP